MKHTTYPTRNGDVELQTRFSNGGMRVRSGDGSLYASANRVTIEPWATEDGVSTVRLWKDGVLTTAIDMKSHVARRFGVECAHGFIDVEDI